MNIFTSQNPKIRSFSWFLKVKLRKRFQIQGFSTKGAERSWKSANQNPIRYQTGFFFKQIKQTRGRYLQFLLSKIIMMAYALH